jgi:aromatic ring-opening dioxygenase LigB subunit
LSERGDRMKYLKFCCVSPHPPIMVPEVGGREIAKVEKSAKALEQLADEIESMGVEALIVMSPHTPLFADSFSVKTAPLLSGSFGMFGAPQVAVQGEPDLQLIDSLMQSAGDRGIPLKKVGRGPDSATGELDHGILVPLYFLARKRYPLVCLSMSLLDYMSHYRLGIAIREAVEQTGRTAVFIASGDMSHRLKPGAPAGYNKMGEVFDHQIVEIMQSAEYGHLFELNPLLIDDAGECGLRSIFTLAGTMDAYQVSSDVLSYEGPFGVGYMVARVEPGQPDEQRRLARE